jgi:tetratricopeptide (TPR) repeat protein
MSESKYSVNAQGANIGAIGDHAQVTQNFTQNIYLQSVDYQRLVEQIRETQESLADVPDSKPERRLKLAEKLQELEAQLEEFKANVFKLYETFTKIEINTERLRLAKAHFDRGEFREADAVLKAAEMTEDLDKLIERERQLDRQRDNVRDSRAQIANEFLIKARLWSTFYDQPHRLEQTCEYFEEALRAARTAVNLFEYAKFLQEHYKLKRAKQLYQEALEIYRELAKQNPATFLPYVANTLNNLAVLHSNTNKMASALSEYQEALGIYRQLAEDNSATFLHYVAVTLNNLGILHTDTNETKSALLELTEALEIRRKLADQNPATFLPNVARTLNNLANLHRNINQMENALSEFTEALEIRRKLANQNPAAFLPDVAMTLNNLGLLHSDTHKMEIALLEFTEALGIYQELANQNPATFLPKVADTLNNLANLHSDTDQTNIAMSAYQEALQIYQDFAKKSPATFLPDVAATLNNLANLHSDTNEIDLAMSAYQEALQIYQDFGKKSPAAFQPKVDHVLRNIAILQNEIDAGHNSGMEKGQATKPRSRSIKSRSWLKNICRGIKNLWRTGKERV